MNFADLPYGPIRDALNSIVGRVALLIATVVLACMLGTWTASGSMLEGFKGIIAVPYIYFVSFLIGYGLLCWPLILAFGIAFVRCELRWRWLFVPLILVWWTSHQVLHSTWDPTDTGPMMSVG